MAEYWDRSLLKDSTQLICGNPEHCFKTRCVSDCQNNILSVDNAMFAFYNHHFGVMENVVNGNLKHREFFRNLNLPGVVQTYTLL